MAWLKTKGCDCPRCGEDECEDLIGIPIFTNVVYTSTIWSFVAFQAIAVAENSVDNGWQCHTATPPNLHFSTIYGYFYGSVSSAGTYTFTVSNTNECGTAYGTVTIICTNCETPTVTSGSASGSLLEPFSYSITATGHGYGSLGYHIDAGLPAGLSLNQTTGVISGTPTNTFNGTIVLRVADTCGSGYGTLHLTITDDWTPGGGGGGCSFAMGESIDQDSSIGCPEVTQNTTGQFGSATFCRVSFQVINGGSFRLAIKANGSTVHTTQCADEFGLFVEYLWIPAGTTEVKVTPTSECGGEGITSGVWILECWEG
jgi:hypothetical protein